MRKANSIKNFLSNVIPYFITAVLGFLQIRIFIQSLGEDIYALNQLFIQVFSYISLVEGGVGAVISQKYFKLFAEDDKESINKTFAASKKAMRKICVLILLIGLVVSFFLGFLTNNSLTLGYMQIVFILYIFRSIIEYLNLSPRFIISADQKIYKINLILNFFKILEVIIEIGLLLLGVDYLLILVASIIQRIIMYYFVNRKIYKEYPWLHPDTSKEEVKIQGIGYMYFHKIAGAIYENTDILLISSKLSSLKVTIYSSYNYIIRYISDVVYMLGSSIVASFGNVIYKENEKDSFNIFSELNSFFLFCGAFFAINVFLLSDSFIGIWLGGEYLIAKTALSLMSFILFASISKRIFTLYVEATALYKETKIIVAVEAGLNLILSLLFIHWWGITGTLLATAIAYLCTTFWYYPTFIYGKKLKQNWVSYFGQYFITFVTTVVLIFGIQWIIKWIKVTNLLTWIVTGVISSLLSLIGLSIVFFLCFPSFKRIINKIISMFKRKKGNK